MRLSLHVAAALLLSASFAAAQKSLTVGIPVAQFNFVSAAQLHTDWCWAASIQMVLNWYNIPVKQSDVVKRIYGKQVDAAASENAIAVALSGTAYDRHNHRVRLNAARMSGIPAPGLLLNELRDRHPMLVTFRSSKTMLHAVVITSANYIQGANGPQLTSLTYSDPSSNIPDRHAAATFRLEGKELQRFLKAVSSYYLFSVRN